MAMDTIPTGAAPRIAVVTTDESVQLAAQETLASAFHTTLLGAGEQISPLLDEVSLAYAVTIHKSQGSEFPAVVIPIATQHYVLLQRNLIYTGLTRGKKLVVLIGQKKALGMAVRNDRTQRRYSGLLERLIA